jgi:hypothetical protein
MYQVSAAQFAFPRQQHQLQLKHHQLAGKEKNTDSAHAPGLALTSETVWLASHLLSLTQVESAAHALKAQ